MSADNYYWVRKRDDGRFGVSHRFASAYYADDYDAEELASQGGDETWISPAPEDIEVHDDPTEAIEAAHVLESHDSIVEYGVQVDPKVYE